MFRAQLCLVIWRSDCSFRPIGSNVLVLICLVQMRYMYAVLCACSSVHAWRLRRGHCGRVVVRFWVIECLAEPSLPWLSIDRCLCVRSHAWVGRHHLLSLSHRSLCLMVTMPLPRLSFAGYLWFSYGRVIKRIPLWGICSFG